MAKMTVVKLERYATKRNKIEAKINEFYDQLEALYCELSEQEDGLFSIRREHPMYGIPSFKITRYEPAPSGGVYCIPVEGEWLKCR